MTKAEERKALAKIKAILEEAGEDSYIWLAFYGCADDAETNIENDWGLSMYDRWQMAEQRYEHANARADEMTADAIAWKEKYEALKAEKELRENNLVEALKAETEGRFKESNKRLAEIREATIETTDGKSWVGRFKEIKYIDHEGFRFVNIVELNGWTTSYKLDDIKTLEIK